MYHALREVMQHLYGMHNLATDMPHAAAAFGVLVGGLVATGLLYSLLAYVCLGRRWRAEWVRMRGEHFVPRPYPSAWRSARYLFVLLLIFVCLCSSIWFGAAMNGFNPWTTAAATIGISIVGTYGFSKILGMAFAAAAVHAENDITVGEYWEFQGMEHWGGVITTINLLKVELMRWDEKNKTSELVVVPIDWFFDRARRRKFYDESTMPLLAIDPPPPKTWDPLAKEHIL